MTSAVLPPAPNWFSAQILRCSDSGSLVAYGAKHCVIVVKCQPEKHFAVRPENLRVPSEAPSAKSSNWRRGPNSPTPSDEGPAEGLSAEDRVYPGVSIVAAAFSNKSKVTSLAWSPDSTHLVAACDEGQVVVMTVQEGQDGKTPVVTPIQMHSVHKNESKDNRYKVNTVSWSRPNPDVVVSGDEMGNLVIWDIKANTTRVVNVGKHNIFVLECHPHDAATVAFGCKLGLILIVNILGAGKIKQKIRFHDEDIQGLSWSPSRKREVFLGGLRSVKVVGPKDDADTEGEEAAADESLLAVSSRDRSITIWSEKSGRQVATLRLPGGGNRNKYDNKVMFWTTCFWWQREILLSSGVHGELLEWNLDKITKKTNDGIFRSDGFGHSEVQVVHKEHARTLYSIHTTGASIQTSGQDRSITSFHWDSHTMDWVLPAFASWVYACVPNHLDPSVVAIGAGDAQIRVWKVGSTKAMFDVNTIWQKLNSAKITALAWHPDKDNLLAFGTDEGRVGTVDAFSRSTPNFCDFKHRGQVYSLCFGPAVGDRNGVQSGDGSISSGKKFLYSCGDGVVMMHDNNSKTLNVDEIINSSNGLDRKQPSRSDMVFQPDTFKHLVLGSDEGTIEVVSVPSLKIVAVLKSFSKLVQSVSWHPLYVGSSSDQSKYKDWIAVSSNETVIHVWDLKSVLTEENSPEPEAVETSFDGDCNSTSTHGAYPVLTSPTQVLAGHHQRVIMINWSPHQDGRLVSVSYDCTVQVWNVDDGGKPVANFSGHGERLFCGIWSPVDPNVIFSGGEDSSLQCWKIDSQKDTLPGKKQPPKKHLLHKNVKTARDANAPPPLPDSTCQSSAIAEAMQQLELKRKELMGNAIADQIGTISSSQTSLNKSDVSEASDPKGRRQKKSKTKEFFQLAFRREHTTKDQAFDDCQKLYEFLYSEDTTPADKSPSSSRPPTPDGAQALPTNSLTDRPHLGFFADKFGMDSLMDLEVQQWKETGVDDAVNNLMLYRGTISDQIRAAIEGKCKLTDLLVSMAAGVSYPLWKEACTAFARQLVKSEDIAKGVSYYLMTHQVLEAITVLRESHYYRSAVAIAKTRFPDDVPLMRELYTAWAYQAQNDGQYELAAKNWIAAGEHGQAASILAKRSDSSSLRVASFLALKAGETDKSRTMALHCIQVCSNGGNVECIDRLMEEVALPDVIQAAKAAKSRLLSEQGKIEEKLEKNEVITSNENEMTDKSVPEEMTTVAETTSPPETNGCDTDKAAAGDA